MLCLIFPLFYKQKEERIWQKAQNMLEKQRKLVKEREELDKRIKLVGNF